jgi:cell shape-determining protein MreC
MSYPLRSRQKKKIGGTLGVVVSIFLIIIFSLSIFSPRLFSAPLHAISVPFWYLNNSLFNDTGVLFGAVFSSKVDLLDENRKLEDLLRESEYLVFHRDILLSENKELKQRLGRHTTGETILAAILVKPNISPYDTLIIDVGSNHGVFLGKRVIVSDSIVIGYVSDVLPNSSYVRLFSSPGEKVEMLLGREHIMVEALGMGGGNFQIMLPREVEISVGDPAIIPGIDAQIFGTVERIEFDSTDTVKRIFLKNPVNIAHLKWVQVLMD